MSKEREQEVFESPARTSIGLRRRSEKSSDSDELQRDSDIRLGSGRDCNVTQVREKFAPLPLCRTEEALLLCQIVNLTDWEQFTCSRCKRDRKLCRLYSADNKTDPGIFPAELQDREIDELLIAWMTIYRRSTKIWRVLNLPRDIQSFLNSLPNNLLFLVIRKQGAGEYTSKYYRTLCMLVTSTRKNVELPHVHNVCLADNSEMCVISTE